MSLSCLFRFGGLAGLILGWVSSVALAQPSNETAALPSDHAERLTRGVAHFKSDVRAILKSHCLKCHGGEKTHGDLDLATREGLLKGGASGPAVIPFQSSKSLMHRLITHADEPAMPDGQPKLPDAVLAKITAWIDDGAPYDEPLIAGRQPPRDRSRVSETDRQWWAFQPLKPVSVPTVHDSQNVINDLDRFIQAKAEEQGLSLRPAAPPRQLLRRAALDLTGLPPTPEMLEQFLVAPSTENWRRQIDQLLESPHYGERWARHWLDVARFAESAGFEHDYDRPGAWAYRDFVIKALNQDLPYNDFIRWQLAGDEFAPKNPLALSATGFLGAGVFPTQITANEVERTRYDAMDDMLSTTGSAFLGLTIGCARCHDHKFDPIPTRDYYQLLATFTTTVRSNLEVDLDPDRTRQLLATWTAAHTPLETAVRTRESELLPKFREWWSMPGDDSEGPAWTVLDCSSIKTESGAKLTSQPDGSYLASGNNATHDRYTFTAETALRRITGLRVEALAHASLPKNGPGRAANGNFALSRVQVTATPKSGGTAQPITLVRPQATFQQNDNSLSVASSLDDVPTTGWAVDPQFGKDHAAVYAFADPLDIPDGAVLQITLDFRVNSQHAIGRPRLSVITEVEPALSNQTLPTAVAQLLQQRRSAAPPSALAPNEEAIVFSWWKTRDAEWKKLQAAVDEHARTRPKGETNILICGEGYPPMRHHTQGADFFKETYILDRGSTDRKQDVAEQSFLQVLMPSGDATPWKSPPPEGSPFSGRRSNLARWITDVDHGAGALAARVIVNRLWQHHFGTGLVTTPNDFGRTGALPSHPELLDWLAGELVRQEWKLKPIHRLILSSATYQQAVFAAPEPALARRHFIGWQPQRLEGEVLRDSMLAVSGQLEDVMYGPGTLNEQSRRRSIYFTMKRSHLMGSMVVFDQPEPLVSQGSRPTTTVAPQALLLMNGRQVREWATQFARRLERESASPSSTAEMVRRGYLLAVSREPTPTELNLAEQFLSTADRPVPNGGPVDREKLIDFCQVLFGLNEFAYSE